MTGEYSGRSIADDGASRPKVATATGIYALSAHQRAIVRSRTLVLNVRTWLAVAMTNDSSLRRSSSVEWKLCERYNLTGQNNEVIEHAAAQLAFAPAMTSKPMPTPSPSTFALRAAPIIRRSR